MKTTTHTTLLVSFLIAALAGCSHGGSGKATSSTTPPPANEPPAASAGETISDAPVVTLLAPGDEPRKLLRIHVTKGQTGRFVMTTRLGIELAVDGKTLSSSRLPGMEISMDVRVIDVAANGDIQYEFAIVGGTLKPEPGTDPNVLKAMQAPLDGMKGVKGHAEITSQGFTKSADFEIPDTLDAMTKQTLASMKESMHQFAAPYPAEPVGRGGRWQVVSMVRMNGMQLKQTATYELMSISGDDLESNVTLEQQADPQDVPLPAAGPDAKMHLIELKSTGSGKMHMNLGLFVPVKARLDASSSMRATVSAGGGQQEMTMKMEIGFEAAGR